MNQVQFIVVKMSCIDIMCLHLQVTLCFYYNV